ncbi:hypothetical protein Elgi_54900 [Paenibacillus elgii]|uniref:radical SAM protein n=1 Tax=Paenibacillus elgii TaxID=189691 RepID=UPI002D7C26E2|nr:hypothetical protein Elgi_54900 [Paenibacillus elgii]
MERIQMDRVIIYVGAVCNLRCKLCSEYIPYTSENPPYYCPEQIKKALYEYFRIVSHVKMIVLTGGEPFINENTAIITEYLSEYMDQYDKLEIMTNGTLLPNESLLRACAKNEKTIIFINHYGELSPKVNAIHEACEKAGVRNTIRKYYGEDAHFGGWFDLGILSGERLTDENELKDRFKHCLTGNNPRLGLSFGLYGGKLFACSVSGIVERLGLMDDKMAYIDLCDDTLSHEQKRDRITALRKSEYLPACAVCHGNDSRVEKQRFVPAEQLS